MIATIRDNITFGLPYQFNRYQAVIKACALQVDFALFQGGDLTEIGEKGINLSGGQKQRIALARAAYSHSSTILLDDPLSAVDAHTMKWLWEECIKKVMAGRTRILVTHATELCLPNAHFMVCLNGGKIVQQTILNPVTIEKIDESILPPFNTILPGVHLQDGYNHPSNFKKSISNDQHRLIMDETKQNGSVKWDVYKTWGSAAGGFFFLPLLILAYLMTQTSVISQDW